MFWSFETKLGFFELYITKNYIFAFWLLKDVPLRFIAQKDLLWFFGVKLGSFQRYCSGKWISFPVFLRVTLIFT